MRETPVRFGGYSIGYRRSKGGESWHPSVRIERTEFAVLKREFAGLATRRTAGELGRLLRDLPFEPYAPVREQFLGLLRLVNRRRRAAGLDPVPVAVLRFHRRSVKRFALTRTGIEGRIE